MPKEFTSSTFPEKYRDDYADSAGYHRVLFNSGRPIQARELTQLQTILQRQVTRFADNIFLDGAAVGTAGAGVSKVAYFISETLPSGVKAKDYVGTTIQGPVTSKSSGLQFLIIHADEATEDGDFPTFYGKYVSYNQNVVNDDIQDNELNFEEADILQDIKVISGQSGMGDLTIRTQSGSSQTASTGYGLLFGCQSATFYTQGYFVYAPKQLITASKYDELADLDVGFSLEQDIVTSDDTDNLFDNQGVVPNISSPGADRYRIRLILTSRSEVQDPNKFVFFASIRQGEVTQIKGGGDSYNEIEKRMAVRHFDTNGSFIVNPWEIRYETGDTADTLKLRVSGNVKGLNPTAFVDGYRLVKYNNETISVNKPTTFTEEESQLINIDYKNYISIPYDSDGKQYLGNLPSNFDQSLQTKLKLADITGTTIGDCRVKHIVSTLETEGLRLHLYDIKMKDGFGFGDVHTVLGDDMVCVPPANFSDSIATYEPQITYIFNDGSRRENSNRAISFTNTAAQELSTYFQGISGRHFEQAGLVYWTQDYDDLIAAGVSSDQAIAIVKGNIRYSWDVQESLAGGIAETLTFCDRLEGNAIPVLRDENGNAKLVDTDVNTTLHKIPGGRVKSISNLVYAVQRQFTATSSPGRSIVLTTQANETFDDISRWVFVNTSNGREERVAPTAFMLNSANPQTASIQVAEANDNYTIYAYVQKNSPQPKEKTFESHNTAISATMQDDSDGKRFVFDLYDGIRLISATADSAGGRDISDQVKFDGGQRDNFYAPVTLRPSGLPSSVSTVHAKFEYFDWGNGGDHFSVNSYVLNDEFRYSDIPVFTSPRDGKRYDLRNHIDYRPKLDPYAASMSATDRFETPRDADNVSYDVQWYNERIDHIAVGYNANDFSTEIRVNQGVESIQPKDPDPKNNELVLYRVSYGGNTLNPQDLSAERVRHRRYRMSDIDKLNTRLTNLEETVSLSFLEQEATNLVELNSNGEVRSKTGFFVDDFKKGLNLTASTIGPDWIPDERLVTQSLIQDNANERRYAVQPRVATETIHMNFDSDNKWGYRSGLATSVGGGSVVRKGDVVMLDYKEVLDSSMVNEVISWKSDGTSSEEQGWYNVNPFNTFSGVGSVQLKPSSDIWHDNRHFPDVNVISEYDQITQGESKDIYSGTSGGKISGGAPRYKLESVVSTVSKENQINKIEEDALAYAVPFARQREIFCKTQGLRPNTRYWAFFDETDVEQWVVAETEADYNNHIKKNDHLKSYPDVDVTIKQHPRKTAAADSVLISDYKGDLFFSFWLPNNAPVPSPSGNSLSSIEEFEEWIRLAEKQAAQHGSSKDPAALDVTGWKFRSGSIELLLNDVSVKETSEGSSHARNFYSSSGAVNVSQKTIYSTEPIVYQDAYQWVAYDPIAQSFTVDGRKGIPGVFVTKVQVFLRKAPQTASRGGLDLAIPLQMQIREMENGAPKKSPPNMQFVKYKPADEVYDIVNNISNLEDIDDVLSNPVTFELDEPVFLKANEEYAIVLLAECDDYEVFVSTTNDLVLGKTEERVSSKTATGSLFLSQNGSGWNARQDQNMAYRIHTAKFVQQGAFNFFNDAYPRYRHNNKILSVDSDDLGRYRVNHIAHGLGVGDKVNLTGLDSTADYLGLAGSSIMDSDLVVDSADTAGYFVRLDGSSFTEAGWFGADSAATNQSMQFDDAVFDNLVQNFPETSVDYQANFISGISHSNIDATGTPSDPRFNHRGRKQQMKSQLPIYFNEPKMLASKQQEIAEIYPQEDSSPSIVIGATLKTNSTSTFGGNRASSIVKNGYVSDVSPIVSLQRATLLMDNHLIDNQPLDSASSSDLNNVPHNFKPETKSGGSSPSKHLTKPVVLEQAANGIRIFVDMYRPPSATVDIYYRTVANTDDDIYEVDWVRVESENEPPANSYSAESYDILKLPYSEYSYLIGGLDGDLEDFTKFQVKAVMRTTNSCEIPTIKSIRAIAVI